MVLCEGYMNDKINAFTGVLYNYVVRNTTLAKVNPFSYSSYGFLRRQLFP